MGTPSAMSFQDHFSGHAVDYAAHRPKYPLALFRYLSGLTEDRALAWDCATGNGQAAVALAAFFEGVIATDASKEQLEAAESHPRVRYVTAPAEASPLEAHSADLVTVAQALHWFDVDAFHREVARVLRPGGFLAVWCYGLSKIAPEIDRLLEVFHYETVGPYWPLERRHIEERYQSLAFPYESLSAPIFEMSLSWTAEELFAYLRTWSSVKRYMKEKGRDPVDRLEEAVRPLWGGGVHEVRWPLTLKVGRCI